MATAAEKCVIDQLPSWYLKQSKSDKVTSWQHHYFGFLYDTLILALIGLKQAPIKVLELGVSYFGQGSGHAFSKMPFVELFVGVDINPISADFDNGNIFICKNTDTADCINTLQAYAPFDLIIHDANHTPESQIYFFQNYPELLAEPGYMVCEDVQSVDQVIAAVKDSKLHRIDVPPMNSVWSTTLVKFNLPSVTGVFLPSETRLDQVFIPSSEYSLHMLD